MIVKALGFSMDGRQNNRMLESSYGAKKIVRNRNAAIMNDQIKAGVDRIHAELRANAEKREAEQRATEEEKRREAAIDQMRRDFKAATEKSWKKMM